MGKDLKGKELGNGISQRTDGSYMGRYYDRFGTRKCVYSVSLKECKEKFAKAMAKNQLQQNVRDEDTTLDQWFDEWIKTYKNKIKPASRVNYQTNYKKHISPRLGTKQISKIITLDVKRLLNNLEKDGYSYGIQNRCRILLQDMFDRAIMDDLAMKNPARGIKIDKNKVYDRRVLTKDEQELFFECAAGTYFYNAYCVQISTGMRPGELFALTDKDIDFDNKKIYVRSTLSYQKFEGDSKRTFHLGEPKTKLSKREIPMTENCESYLKKQIKLRYIVMSKKDKGEICDIENLLFVSDRGNPLNVQTYNDSIERILFEINRQLPVLEQIVGFSGHTLRHTFATRCIENGMQPKVLQKLLGHATLKMTMDLYVHVTDDYMGKELDKMEIDIAPKGGVHLGVF